MLERIEKLMEYVGYDADIYEDECFFIDTDGDIHVCYDFDSDADTDLQIYIEETFEPKFGYDWFLFSVMHEIGHGMTLDLFDSYDQAMYKIAADQLEELEQTYDVRKTYWELDIEYAANEWAVNWLNDPEHLRVAREILYA